MSDQNEPKPEIPAPEEPKRKSKVKVMKDASPQGRRHLVTTVYKNEIAAKLDKLHTEGHTILAITASSDVRGFEVISYSGE